MCTLHFTVVEVLLELVYVQLDSLVLSQPGGRAPPKGHEINLRGHVMIHKHKVLIHKSLFTFWTTLWPLLFCEMLDNLNLINKYSNWAV